MVITCKLSRIIRPIPMYKKRDFDRTIDLFIRLLYFHPFVCIFVSKKTLNICKIMLLKINENIEENTELLLCEVMLRTKVFISIEILVF